MKPLSTPAAEAALAAAVGALALAAVLAPATGLPAGYHDFADQRAWLGLPNAMDVLSNAPFAALGVWGLAWLRRAAARVGAAQRALAALFFVGLIATAACSAGYHLHPDHAGLCLDRLGMSVAFAGLLGLAVADRLSARAGLALAAGVAVAAPATALLALRGNMTPWALLQGGGLLLLLALARRAPRPGALGFSIAGVLLAYGAAKALELTDAPVFALTGQLLSGHSAKHLLAAAAALAPIVALRRLAGAPQRWPRRAGLTPGGTLP